MRVIDPKYHIEGEEIIKTSNGERVPDEEPLILFRARDVLAIGMLYSYRQDCIEAGCTQHQIEAVTARIQAFEEFAKDHPEKMKQPGITKGK